MKNYFKKFSMMFVMSLAIIGFGMIQNGGEVNAATVGQSLTSPDTGWQRVENTDSNINYSSGWMLNSHSGDSGGNDSFINVGKDSYVKFNFISNEIRIIIPYNSLHNNYVELYIDKVKVDTLELNFSNLRQVLVYENTNLADSEHSFEMRFVGTGQGVFDAVDIDKNGELKPYNENIESITLDKSTINLTEGDSDKLTAITTPSGVGVTWTSSDPSIATIEVDPINGKITKVNALKEGTCTITATTADGSNLSASCTINVTKKDKPDNTTTDTKTGAILIINLTDGETKVFDVSSSEVDNFKSWYNNKSEFENKLTYVFNKTVNSNISIEEDVVHNQITSFEIRKY